jgi:hypothetical protein
VLPLLREWTHVPIVVDPAHAAGIARIIPPLSRASIAAGADGVAVEVHLNPAEARSDGPQALLPSELVGIVSDARILAAATGRRLHPSELRSAIPPPLRANTGILIAGPPGPPVRSRPRDRSPTSRMVAPPIARRAALVAPPWGLVYGAFRPAARVGVFYPPLGLCALAAVLRKEGWAVRVVDAEAESLDLEGVARTLDEFRPTFVGIQVVSPLWEAAVALARLARTRLDVPVLLGGPHVTLLAEEALEQNPWADAAAIGEGEETILEFARAIDAGRDPRATDGLVVREGDRIARTGPRASPADLDALPDPDRAGLPSHRYLFSVPGQGNRRFTTISSARGCPFECTFCTEPVMHGRRVRYRSPRVVVDEIAAAREDPGASHFVFVDDTLTLDAGRILEICERIRAEGSRSRSRAGPTRTRSTSGCSSRCAARVSCGSPSGSRAATGPSSRP